MRLPGASPLKVDFDRRRTSITLNFCYWDPFNPKEKDGKVYDGVFNQNNTTGGKLLINLGEDISEDFMGRRWKTIHSKMVFPADG